VALLLLPFRASPSALQPSSAHILTISPSPLLHLYPSATAPVICFHPS
jgi:hypothetical protein